jgi:glyoxylase-like metal-dependent hydrolase (beta-lactamase superfamily II)
MGVEHAYNNSTFERCDPQPPRLTPSVKDQAVPTPYELVLEGVPVSSKRGALGWCNVALLRRGDTTILFDTGSYGDRALMLARLDALGVTPSKIDLLFASHFHFDHVANAELFDCPMLISAPERAYVEEKGYLRSNDPFVPLALASFVAPRLVTVRDGQEIVPGVRVMVLPGHTPGTAGLLLEDDGVILAADAVKNAWDFVRNEPPPAFFSRETGPANYRRIREVADRVVPGHDRAFTLNPDGSVQTVGGPRVAIDVYADPCSDPRNVALVEEK